jgi:DNA-binding Lrp family transcriptional regulator
MKKFTAILELKVKSEEGFDKLANLLKENKFISELYLVSGSFDFMCFLDASPKVVGDITAELSAYPEINSTRTHFVLKDYSEIEVDNRECVL